ncbi:metallophosphatase family protein [Xanthomonas hortorum pv. hederae]|nr:metallophosphatase family protein [Xanthomonas hortorum pv. hederae]PUF01420.1 metallophosphatase family protein [Xanthomonas hortorum pv. hederae]
MRIAHFSDLHYGPRNLAEADRCFGAAIDAAIAARAEVAVLSGDATDHALDLHAPSTARLAGQLRRLADHCPVLMLQGTYSHEPPGTLAVPGMLGGRHPIQVVERIGQVALAASGGWIASPGWRFDEVPADAVALFSCVPTVNKAAVAAAMGAGEAATAVGEQLQVVLRGFAPGHRAARRRSLPCVGVSHGTVFGAVSEHGVPMAGFDHEFTTGALFAAEAQAFLLGHIHRHQAWERTGPAGLQRIAYAGSIGRFHYGEADEKGWLLWEVEADGAQCRLMPTPARRTLELDFDGPPDLEAIRRAVAEQEIEGAFVRVRWRVAEEDRHDVDRKAIEGLLAGAAGIKLEGRIVPVQRSRAAGIAGLVRLPDKIRAWAKVSDVRAAPLLECLAALEQQSPEQVAAAVLSGAEARQSPG